MKNITEILGGAQLLLGVSFDLQDAFEEYAILRENSAYNAQDIRTYVAAKGRVAIIEGNKRKGESGRWLDAAEKQRFKIRSTVERANSHLKDWLLGGKVYVRGIRKGRFHLMSGVVCLATVKILQYLVIPFQDAQAA